jgi:four helix bundle protein
MVESYEDLEVWKRGIVLVTLVYKLTDKLPSKERFRLVDQMCRAAASIPANIAEGSSRKSTKEFMRYVSIVIGSLAELKTHVVVAQALHYYDHDMVKDFKTEAAVLGKQLNALYAALGRKL